ncbi:MAG: hypothetical protein JWO75_6203, partial [Actinomycetia bacterium]|nr:hypothetical protein [Actinomycetes bacterium]
MTDSALPSRQGKTTTVGIAVVAVAV